MSEKCCGNQSDINKEQTSSCCPSKAQETVPQQSPCCGSATSENKVEVSCCDTDSKKFDYLLWCSAGFVVFFYAVHLVNPSLPNNLANTIHGLGHASFDLVNTMAWGALFGIVMVALLSRLPREIVISALGTNRGWHGLLRATGAGLLLDLCSHGILMVGAKLYERGVSTGQVMAFLIASPWNSFSLTLILIALIGLTWTLIFIVLSIAIALLTGFIFDVLIEKNVLPRNPNRCDLPEDYQLVPAIKNELASIRITSKSILTFITDGVKESRMVLRWLFFGIVLASLIRVFVPEDIFGTYFGPTILGLGVTLITATVLEVCSEGSTPIAADIFNRAGAPGNSFAFLMTGVSTDYTEIMVLKDTTRSWKLALFLPLVTLPQVIMVALLISASQ